ncbi:hypothetical protein EVG20_g8114 [Dentipellis fragilis]|uniref:Protein kinase domain-containing protein n=1 Tax=Dentipellis fragilis TaxID=205917 RepID=A0A4Y9Y854_9AGAM|nr:hypothetical protein EVG20_g8114 [Dentipellis fragilis]
MDRPTSSPHSTPVKKRSSVSTPLTDPNPPAVADIRYNELSKDMHKQFVGPMPVADFLKDFVPKARRLAPSPGDVFGKLKSYDDDAQKGDGAGATKRSFEDCFIDAVNKAGICPDLELLNTTSKVVAKYVYDQKPDISVCRKTSSGDALQTTTTAATATTTGTAKSNAASSNLPTSPRPVSPPARKIPTKSSSPVHWFRMELCIEAKRHVEDPFSDPPPSKADERATYHFEKTALKAIHTRGQLISYASAHMSTQFRCFCFSVCLVDKTNARLIRWDRSGAIVSERFDFTKAESPLAEFLWRFNHLDDAQRGRDLSVTSASEEEAALARKHSMEGDIHKILVTNDADKVDHYFLVSAPSVYRLVVTGRASFGYIALDMQTKKKVWLKDSWRIDLDDMKKEFEIYKLLEKHSVRNISPLVCGGDVAGQMTVTQNYADAAWRSGEVDLLPHHHYRLVLETIGRPLKDFKSTKEMVRATYHAFLAHWDAYSLANILHRDISGGNILIVEDKDTTRGILIDWDLSKDRDAPPEPRRNWRTGTWQFMSAGILRNRFKLHEYQDDMESFLHVVSYHSLRYRPCTLITYNSDMYDMFEAAEERDDSEEVIGGKGKLHFFGYTLLRPHELKKTLPSPLADLINEIRKPFRYFYMHPMEMEEDHMPKKIVADGQVRSAHFFFGIWETYLASDTWPVDDQSEDQLKSLPGASTSRGVKRKADSFGQSSLKARKVDDGDVGGSSSRLASISEMA